MRSVPYTVVEKIKTHFIFKFFFFENRADCDIMWKNTIESEKPLTAMQYGAKKMRFACRISKASMQTHSLNV
jgi:hypothetical protein